MQSGTFGTTDSQRPNLRGICNRSLQSNSCLLHLVPDDLGAPLQARYDYLHDVLPAFMRGATRWRDVKHFAGDRGELDGSRKPRISLVYGLHGFLFFIPDFARMSFAIFRLGSAPRRSSALPTAFFAVCGSRSSHPSASATACQAASAFSALTRHSVCSRIVRSRTRIHDSAASRWA